jgi:hypothetical protein
MAENTILFSKDFEEQAYGPIEPGDYEVVIGNAEVRKTKSGDKEYLSLDFVIRRDVNQEYKGRHVFESLWRDRNNPEVFEFAKLNKIILTQKDAKLAFKEMDEVIQYLNGLKLVITIETIFDEYDAKERNVVKKMSYAPSNYPEDQVIESNTASIALNSDDGKDDLPF